MTQMDSLMFPHRWPHFLLPPDRIRGRRPWSVNSVKVHLRCFPKGKLLLSDPSSPQRPSSPRKVNVVGPRQVYPRNPPFISRTNFFHSASGHLCHSFGGILLNFYCASPISPAFSCSLFLFQPQDTPFDCPPVHLGLSSPRDSVASPVFSSL